MLFTSISLCLSSSVWLGPIFCIRRLFYSDQRDTFRFSRIMSIKPGEDTEKEQESDLAEEDNDDVSI